MIYESDAGRASAARERTSPALVAMSLEAVLVVALAVLALILRLADLDMVPLGPAEAREALAAWRVVEPRAAFGAETAASPWLLLVQTVAFALLGASESTARLGTALAGTVLVLAPLLFRRWLGRERALLFAALLAFSPVALLASREASGPVWTLLWAAGALWCALRFRDGAGDGYAIAATALGAGALVLTDGAAPLLALVLILALAVARWLGSDDEEPASAAQRPWPWRFGLIAAAALVFLVATQLMLRPSGVSSIGALLERGLRGLTTPEPGAPPLHALAVSLFYEPWVWLFALVGLALAWRRGMASFADRFLAAWLALGVVALALYAGTTPAHGLWLAAPLAGLASRAALAMVRGDEHGIWDTPDWARGLLALLTVALLAMMAVAAQLVARALARNTLLIDQPLAARVDPIGTIVLLMGLLFFVVGFFLAANLWERGTAARGLGLGLLIFGMVTSLASGWHTAVPGATTPSLWRPVATTLDAPWLRQTLFELSRRESRGMPSLDLAVQAGDDGVLAWLLRDYTEARRVAGPADARGEPIVLLPLARLVDVPSPDLGGSYVGQDFVLTRRLDLSGTSGLSWWLERRPAGSVPDVLVGLYVRQDVYEGTATR